MLSVSARQFLSGVVIALSSLTTSVVSAQHHGGGGGGHMGRGASHMGGGGHMGGTHLGGGYSGHGVSSFGHSNFGYSGFGYPSYSLYGSYGYTRPNVGLSIGRLGYGGYGYGGLGLYSNSYGYPYSNGYYGGYSNNYWPTYYHQVPASQSPVYQSGYGTYNQSVPVGGGVSGQAVTSTSDLRPGMVLPDGATVISVGPISGVSL